MTNHVQIKSDLFLISQEIKKVEVKTVLLNTHHIFVIDCSGSMSGELRTIRKDLHNKISTSLKENDSLTIIWFSGKGQYGVVIEDYQIKSNTSLTKVKEMIDRYLTPVGLTSFKEPFEEAKAVISRVIKDKPNVLNSLFFITDGADNQNSNKEILQVVTTIKEDIASSTIIEYGYYCNKELLSKIAFELGGAHIFSQDFQDFEPYMSKQFSKENMSKRTYVKLDGPAVEDLVFTIDQDGQVINYSVNDKGEVLISEDEKNVFYYSVSPIGTETVLNMLEYSKGSMVYAQAEKLNRALYASLFSFSRVNNWDKVSEILKFIGDARLIVKKANTFGSQKINELENDFLNAISNPSLRFTEGYNPDLEPKEDAYCVLDMIKDLMEHEENVFYPGHEAFKYERIGSKQVAKPTVSEDEKNEFSKLLEEGKLEDLQNKLAEAIQNKKDKSVKFEKTNQLSGHPFSDLVWNEKRANLSIQVTYKGTVNLPKKFESVPEIFETVQFRNYTLIKDGVVHTYELPVSFNKGTFDKLQSEGLLDGEIFEENKIYVLNFSSLPVINRKMVNTMSAEELFKNEYELLKLKANNTVFNHYRKNLIGKVSYDFIQKYGEEAAAWLKELGITASGFNPPSTLEKTGEEIFVNSLKIKIDKLTLMTSLTDFNKVLDKYKQGKPLTGREELLLPGIQEFEAFLKSMEGIDDQTIIENWIDKKSKLFKKRKNELMNSISQSKFLCIVGKSWFKEFSSREEKSLTINIDGKDILFELDDKMEKVTL